MQIPSISHELGAATRRYYGTDTDPLRYAPTVSKPQVAEPIARYVNGQLDKLRDEELVATALRIQTRDRLSSPKIAKTLDELKQEALKGRLSYIVVNAELQHAAAAPGDFNEDSERSGAYEMGLGVLVQNIPPSLSA